MLTPSALNPEQRLLRLYFLGAIALAEGRHVDALGFLEPVLKQDEYNDHAELLERCRFIAGCVYEAQEQYLPALDTFTACARAIKQGIVDEPIFTLQVYFALAEHHRRLERRDVAIAWYQQALSQLPFLVDPTTLAEASADLSQRHLQNVHSTLADWYAARSRVLYELVGARQLFTQASANFGLILQETGNIPTAEQQLRQTIEFCKQLGTPYQGILTNIALADLLLERQDAAEAERLALNARELCRPSEPDQSKDDLLYGRIPFPHADDTLYGRILVTLADAVRAQGRLDEAERLFQEAIELLKQLNANEHLSQAYFRYSTLLNQKGMVAESYEMVKQAFLLSTRREL
jgi:tetratricopeptide (TPR) repeat protein